MVVLFDDEKREVKLLNRGNAILDQLNSQEQLLNDSR
jgi:hypothetical protein